MYEQLRLAGWFDRETERKSLIEVGNMLVVVYEFPYTKCKVTAEPRGPIQSWIALDSVSRMKIDHLSFMVSSLEQSMRYYDALLPLLGFAKKRDHVWFNSSGQFLQFREATPGSRPYERYGAGMNHIGFSAENPDRVYAVRESMLATGFSRSGDPESEWRDCAVHEGPRRHTVRSPAPTLLALIQVD